MFAAAILLATDGVKGQALTTLYTFSGGDGANPGNLLLGYNNLLYGTTLTGGNPGNGTVFALNTNGTGFQSLYVFSATDTNGFNVDGSFPDGSLTWSGSTLYGATSEGGPYGAGTVFAVGAGGTGFTNLYGFTGENDGGSPQGGLILAGGFLFGAAQYGGDDDSGSVFKLSTNGSGFTVLHSFSGVNGDGAIPAAGLTWSGSLIYGTTSAGGSGADGTVFKINTDGSGFATLYSFSASDANGFNNDGASPYGALIVSSNSLYGTTSAGGSAGNGTVFKVNTDGTGFITLHSFSALDTNGYNADGAYPYAGLLLSSNTLYGTTSQGGGFGAGTLFAIRTDATSFTNVYTFTDAADGGFPESCPILLGNVLIGTAEDGGHFDSGTIFEIPVSGNPPVTIISGPLSMGLVSIPYTAQLGATGGQSPYIWSFPPGPAGVPPGLSLSPQGVLSGTPTSAGQFTFDVDVTDSNGHSATQAVSVTIKSESPVISSPGVAANGRFQLALEGNGENSYMIQFSSNLVDWQTVLMTNGVSAQKLWLQFSASNRAGFFRSYESSVALGQSIISFGTNAAVPVFRTSITNGSFFVPVVRSGAVSNSLCINYAAVGGAAADGCSFFPVSGTVCFAPGAVSNGFLVPLYFQCLTTNLSQTINLVLSDTNGVNALVAQLVVEIPPPALSVSPTNLMVLVGPTKVGNGSCGIPQLVVSNSGPPFSVLAYHVSVDDTNLSKYITIDGIDSQTGESGELQAGQSYTLNVGVPQQYLFTNGIVPLPLNNAAIPLTVRAPTATNVNTVQVELALTNEMSLALGTWSGTCSAGAVSGPWVMVVDSISYFPACYQSLGYCDQTNADYAVNGTFYFGGSLPYYNGAGLLVSLDGGVEFPLTGAGEFDQCGNCVVTWETPVGLADGSGYFTAAYDSGLKLWQLVGIVPLNLLAGTVTTNAVLNDPYVGPYDLEIGIAYTNKIPPGNFGGYGLFYGARQKNQ